MADAAQAVADKAASKQADKQQKRDTAVAAAAPVSSTGVAGKGRRTLVPSVTQQLSNDNKADKQGQTAANKSKKGEDAQDTTGF